MSERPRTKAARRGRERQKAALGVAGGYRATPELERRLERERQVSLTGGRYAATVAKAGSIYEAWTDTLPFVYGRPAPTLEAALDSLEERYRDVERAARTRALG